MRALDSKNQQPYSFDYLDLLYVTYEEGLRLLSLLSLLLLLRRDGEAVCRR
jgi:hypothetical protein